MANYFNADYYFAAKAKQLSNSSDGKTWTAAEVKAEFTKMGITAEQHYLASGQSEGLQPNAYFNETEYLESKLKALQEGSATKGDWTGKSVADLKAEFTKMGITAAEHYEKAGAFETRADGTLLNPSNAFDANAYFGAKLAQLQEAGFDGADTMTVQDVVNALKAAGASPVSHFLISGAAEAKADGVPLVQTVPSEQRMPNDPGRTAFGENVPSNYNPPSKAPAAAVAAPVTKPADVGGLSAAAPAAPSTPVKVPGDAGYIAPPATLKDLPGTTIILPTASSGTGPNASFIVVDNVSGEGTVIKLDGETQGTIAKVEKDANGNFVQPKPETPITGPNGEETNTEPKNDNGDPVDPPTPVDPPAPGPGPVDDPHFKTVTVPNVAPADANAGKIASLLNDVTTGNQKDGVLYTGGTDAAAKGKYSLTIAKSDTTGKMPGEDKTATPGDGQAAAVNLHGTKLVAKDLNVKSMNVALVDADADGAITAVKQVISLALKGNTTIGDVTGAGYIGAASGSGFNILGKDGDPLSAAGNYKYNLDLAVSGADNAIQMNDDDVVPSIIKVTGGAGSALRIDNVLAKNISGSTTEYQVKKDVDFTLEAVFQDNTSAAIDLSKIKNESGVAASDVIDKLVLVDDAATSATAVTVALGGHKTTIELASYTDKAWDQNLTISGGATADELTLTRSTGTGTVAISGGAIVVNLGSGSNTLTMDYALLGEMNASSGFSGSSTVGTDTDTLKLTGATLTRAETISFADFTLTDIDVLDVSTIDSSDKALTLDVTNVDVKLAINGVSTTDQQLMVKTDTGAKEYAVTTGSGNDSVTFTSAEAAAFTTLKLVADLGDGNNTLAIDINAQATDTISFDAASEFTGGTGTDTLKLVNGGSALSAAYGVNFSNLELTDVENLDLSAITTTDTLTVTFSDATTLSVTGATGKTALVMGASGDSITFSGEQSLQINTGKGADSVNIAGGTEVDTIAFTLTDFFDSTVGQFSAEQLDTITGFTAGSVKGDKLGLNGFTTASALETKITTAAAATFADNKIYVIEDAGFKVESESTQASIHGLLFGTGKYFAATTDSAAKSVIIVRGEDASYVFYADAGTGDTEVAATELAYVTKLVGVNHEAGDFTFDNITTS